MKKIILFLSLAATLALPSCKNREKELEKEVAALKQQLTDCSNSENQKDTLVVTQEGDLTKLSDTIDVKQKAIDVLKAKSKLTKEEKAKLKELQESMTDLSQKCRVALSSVDTAKIKNETTKAKIANMQNLINKYKDEKNANTGKDKTLASLSSENTQLKADLQFQQNENKIIKKELDEIRKEIYLSVSSVTGDAKKALSFSREFTSVNLKCKVNPNSKVSTGNKTMYVRLTEKSGRVVETDKSAEFNFDHSYIQSTAKIEFNYQGNTVPIVLTNLLPKAKQVYKPGIYDAVFYLEGRIIGSQTVKL